VEFQFEPLNIPDVLLVTHGVVRDQRGFFLESYREEPFTRMGLPGFVQDNHAKSTRGVLRGMHYQLQPAGIGKLVRCIRGRIFDVAVDIRRGSPSFGRWVGLELTEGDCRMLYIPEGFAHGYCTLSDEAEVFYKTSGYYSPQHERAIRWSDPTLNIQWPVADPVLSDKDRKAPCLQEAENNFTYDS
jgi:dTDP-4-dehydrorhamnose 3,5-epimerase